MKKIILFSTLFVLPILALSGCGQTKIPVNKTASASSFNLNDGAYNLLSDASRLEWQAHRFVMPGYHKGTLKVSSGQINIKNQEVESGDFVFDMQSITDEDLSYNISMKTNLENHLKSADFFAAAKFSEAKLHINSGKKTSENKYFIKGDLTIKEITKPVEFTVEFTQKEQGRLIAQSEFEIDRTNWDIKYQSGKFFTDLGDQAIDDKIKIALNLVFVN